MAYGFGATYGTGATDVVTFPNSAAPGGSITYHFRVNIHSNSSTTSGRVFLWGDANASSASYMYYYEGDNKYYWNLATSGTFGEWTVAAPSFDTWVDIVVTQSGTSAPTIYFDGVSQVVSQTVAPSGTAVTATGKILRVGNYNTAVVNRDFNGQIAEFAIWSGRILGAAEIDALADGLSPDCIPQNLSFYAPLVRDAVNLLDNSAPTVTGALPQPHPRVYTVDASQGTSRVPASSAAVGSASGTGSASGVGASTAASVGAASGTGAASGVGASTARSVGSAAGLGAASGVGAGTAASVGSAAGTGSASGVGASTAAAVGSAAGTGTASGVGQSTAASVGSAAGTGAASGAGSSTAASVGSAAGTGTASGVGASTAAAVGSAAGTGTATGTTDSASVGAASGTGAASGVGASTAAAVGVASGTGTATAPGAATASAVGAASGTGTATAVAAEAGSVGVASGTGAAVGVGASVAAAVGVASGTGDAIAVPFVDALQRVQGGFELAGNYLGGRKRKRRKDERSEEELRAERFKEIIREVEIATGLRPPPEPDARSQDSDAGPSVGSAAAPGAEDAEVPDNLSLALLDRLLALPAEEIRLPIEPFPHILSEGRATAMEAARLHAIRLRDDEAAIAAILAAMVL